MIFLSCLDEQGRWRGTNPDIARQTPHPRSAEQVWCSSGNKCVLCEQAAKTHEDLFSGVLIRGRFGKQILSWLGHNHASWQHGREIRWINQRWRRSNIPNTFKEAIFASCLYSAWQKRSLRTLNQQSRSSGVLQRTKATLVGAQEVMHYTTR
ncbi:hypothetical protein Ancab_034147 [Ancistrocladus abbreviatus]